MTACPHTLATGPLTCTQEAGHDYGHTFASTSGVPDRHELGDDE
ncbi:MAG: hypothetical protein ACXVGA_03680 [Mycobacteriaceae bacterium]